MRVARSGADGSDRPTWATGTAGSDRPKRPTWTPGPGPPGSPDLGWLGGGDEVDEGIGLVGVARLAAPGTPGGVEEVLGTSVDGGEDPGAGVGGLTIGLSAPGRRS